MNTATNAVLTQPERRMDLEFTATEIERLYLLAIRDRARTHDQDPDAVNLARKLTEYNKRVKAA